MKAKIWPPKDIVKEVIAYFDDYGWIEVRQGYKYVDKVKPESWVHGFYPMGLPSHGCGCCSDDDPTPTHWITKPEVSA